MITREFQSYRIYTTEGQVICISQSDPRREDDVVAIPLGQMEVFLGDLQSVYRTVKQQTPETEHLRLQLANINCLDNAIDTVPEKAAVCRFCGETKNVTDLCAGHMDTDITICVTCLKGIARDALFALPIAECEKMLVNYWLAATFSQE